MKRLVLIAAFLGPTAAAVAQANDVTAHITVSHAHHTHGDSSNVVLWLTPLSPNTPAPAPPQTAYTLAQRDKEFTPHLLVVPTGSSISFPNQDPFFHNVFSLFNGKRFDLGLYEGHTKRSVRFDREGISYIFCNIHPDMGAVIVSVSTPYFAQSNADGTLTLHNVPAGKYRLNLWAENVPADRLATFTHTVDITGPTALPAMHLDATGNTMTHHTNKFGEPYKPLPKDTY